MLKTNWKRATDFAPTDCQQQGRVDACILMMSAVVKTPVIRPAEGTEVDWSDEIIGDDAGDSGPTATTQ